MRLQEEDVISDEPTAYEETACRWLCFRPAQGDEQGSRCFFRVTFDRKVPVRLSYIRQSLELLAEVDHDTCPDKNRNRSNIVEAHRMPNHHRRDEDTDSSEDGKHSANSETRNTNTLDMPVCVNEWKNERKHMASTTKRITLSGTRGSNSMDGRQDGSLTSPCR